MGRGPGIWQKFILEQVNALELHQLLPVHHLLEGSESRSDKEAVRRAARTLAKNGLIQTSQQWVKMEHNGSEVERLGMVMARADAEPIPQRRMSFREIASAMGISHNTVAKISREQDQARREVLES